MPSSSIAGHVGNLPLAEAIAESLRAAQCRTDAALVEKLAIYIDGLYEGNKIANLVGAKDRHSILFELVCDSFYLSVFLKNAGFIPSNANIWDLGAGAGLPGIPLRLLWQEGAYTMIEQREIRAKFVQKMLGRLDIPNTAIFAGSIHNFLLAGAENGNMPQADCIISRAFMPWRKLLKYCHPIVKDNGMVIVLANEAPPGLPRKWLLHSFCEYQANGRCRHIWAVAPHRGHG